jgi:hypothetical protein
MIMSFASDKLAEWYDDELYLLFSRRRPTTSTRARKPLTPDYQYSSGFPTEAHPAQHKVRTKAGSPTSRRRLVSYLGNWSRGLREA